MKAVKKLLLFILLTPIYFFSSKISFGFEKELSYQQCFEGIVTGVESYALCSDVEAKVLFEKLKPSLLIGNNNAALYLERLVKIRPFDLEPRLTLAHFFIEKDNIEKASSHVRILSKIYPHHPAATLISAEFQIKLGLVDDALRQITQTIKIHGPDPQLLNLQAEILEKKGLYAQASEILLKARQLKEELVKNDFSGERLQIKSDKIQTVINVLEEKSVNKPKVAEYYDVLGDAYKKLGKIKIASQRYRKAISLSPNNLSVRVKFAKTLIELGHLEEARLQLSYVIVSDKNNATAVYQLARIHLIEQNYALAGKLLQRWHYDHPKDMWSTRSHARLWAYLSEPTLATSISKKYNLNLAITETHQKNARNLNASSEPCLVHLVKPEDSLTSIAKQYLGDSKKWNLIFEANKDRLTTPNHIQIGWELKIPINKSDLCNDYSI